jgi:uncharacterized protein YbcV (DUF1398 family)
MDTQAIHDVMVETQAGKLIFPEVVRRLLDAGVESYFVDFASGLEMLYMTDGRRHLEEMTLPLEPVSHDYSAADIVAAIRGTQVDKVRYPEFVKLSILAGVVGYWAFLTGKKVIYFGRKGEMHT